MILDASYGYDRDGNIIITKPDGNIKITPNNLCLTNMYGNKLTINETSMIYQQNSPTYHELYECWLKTKQND